LLPVSDRVLVEPLFGGVGCAVVSGNEELSVAVGEVHFVASRKDEEAINVVVCDAVTEGVVALSHHGNELCVCGYIKNKHGKLQKNKGATTTERLIVAAPLFRIKVYAKLAWPFLALMMLPWSSVRSVAALMSTT